MLQCPVINARLLLCLLAMVPFSMAPLSASAQPASMFHADASHSGVYQSPAPANLNLRWKFQTGGPVVSSPTVANGVVYFGSADHGLYAVDASTGKLDWKFDAHGDVNSSPAVANGSVYVVSLDGNLYAVDAATGKERWAFRTQGERRFSAPGLESAQPATEVMSDPWDFYLSSPAVANNTVYFGSGDGNVYAVDATTGALRWKFKTGNVVHASPAVAGGIVYIGSWDTYFYALDARTGRMLWKFKTGEDPHTHLMTGIQGSAAVARGRVYFGCRDGHLYALNATTGALDWKFATGGSWIISTPAVDGSSIYFTTSDSHRFEALDADTGKPIFALPDRIYSFSSSAIAGGHAYFGTFDGKLHAVDLAAYRYSGVFAVPGFYANSAKYLDAQGHLQQQAVWKGDTMEDMVVDIRARMFSLGSILSSPAVSHGVVYFTSVDGALYALGGTASR